MYSGAFRIILERRYQTTGSLFDHRCMYFEAAWILLHPRWHCRYATRERGRKNSMDLRSRPISTSLGLTLIFCDNRDQGTGQ